MIRGNSIDKPPRRQERQEEMNPDRSGGFQPAQIGKLGLEAAATSWRPWRLGGYLPTLER